MVALGAVALPAAVWAEDGQIPAAYIESGQGSPLAVYAAATKGEGAASADGLGQSADNETLANASGGTNIKQNTTLDGTVNNTTADHVISGDNLIDGNSFNGAAGIPMVIQNSGSNVLIQNATVVNVQFKP
uniref:hypothetical protein n=1 Tax=Dyella soli TaxID=522319 RepID=UPI00197AD4D1|nr:hypothetical protein [Dyella soli]